MVQRQFYHQVSVCYRRGIFRHLVIRCVIIPLGETGNFQLTNACTFGLQHTFSGVEFAKKR